MKTMPNGFGAKMRNASFATVDGVDYIVIDDGEFSYAVKRDTFNADASERAKDYIAWRTNVEGVVDAALAARIAKEAGVPGVHLCDGQGTWVPAGMPVPCAGELKPDAVSSGGRAKKQQPKAVSDAKASWNKRRAAAPETPEDIWRLKAIILALVFPGLGHFYVRRNRMAKWFMIAVLLMLPFRFAQVPAAILVLYSIFDIIRATGGLKPVVRRDDADDDDSGCSYGG